MAPSQGGWLGSPARALFRWAKVLNSEWAQLLVPATRARVRRSVTSGAGLVGPLAAVLLGVAALLAGRVGAPVVPVLRPPVDPAGRYAGPPAKHRQHAVDTGQQERCYTDVDPHVWSPHL